MTVREHAEELKAAGWTESWKVRLLAARYYRGLETTETLQQAHLTAQEINHIIYMR